MTGNESSSSDNANGLAEAVFQLLQAGARTVIAAHHSPKNFEGASYMSLENVLRGSGDIGAMAATVWGVRMLDAVQTKVQVENVKPRDFTPPPPFQLQGRPYIDEGKGMQMVLPPGSCGTLRNYVEPKKGGRPPSPVKAGRAEQIQTWLREGKPEPEIKNLLKNTGLSDATARKEISEARGKLKFDQKMSGEEQSDANT
jgi:hypothetical protein